MGYGRRALQILQSYYEGKITNLSEVKAATNKEQSIHVEVLRLFGDAYEHVTDRAVGPCAVHFSLVARDVEAAQKSAPIVFQAERTNPREVTLLGCVIRPD